MFWGGLFHDGMYSSMLQPCLDFVTRLQLRWIANCLTLKRRDAVASL